MSHNHDPSHISRRQFLALTAGGVGAAVLVGICGNSAYESLHKPKAPWDPSGIDTGPSPTPSAQASHETVRTHEAMKDSTDAQLRRLAGYETELGQGFGANMLVAGMPRSAEEAQNQATNMAARLKEYAKYGVQPIVVMEPRQEEGQQMLDLRAMSQDQNTTREVWEAYFQTLRQSGVTDKEMGAWVPFPAPNSPDGKKDGVTDPAVFRDNLTLFAQSLKAHYRSGHVSVLLNGTSYPSGDTAHQQGTSNGNTLLSYISGIPAGLVDSFGLQGFPEKPGDTAAEYLPAQSAMACASRLGVKEVWFNTGSYARTRDADGQVITATPEQRGAQLLGAFTQAFNASQQGFNVRSVNLNAQDCFDAGAPDYSYTKENGGMSLLSLAVQDAPKVNIPVTLLV